MSKNALLRGYPVNFLLLYGATFATNAVYNTFLPVYLNHAGFTGTLVGTLLAVGPFVALFAQPFWGLAGDRARSKNAVLRVLLAGSALLFLLYPVWNRYAWLFSLILLFNFFNTSLMPLQDAVALESIEGTGWRYGPIRMAGTIGFAVLSILAGLVSGRDILAIFPLYGAVAAAAFLITFRIPAVPGHQSRGRAVAPWKLLKNRDLALLMAFSFVLFITLGYYYSFFPIHYKQMGASNLMVGLSMVFSSCAEIPFLLFANRIVGRLGIRKTLLLSAAVMAVRWLLLYFVTDVYAIPFVNMLHGFSFIVCTYCMVMYINEHAPMELKASGQTMLALLAQGVSRILGSVLGGLAGDALGVRQVFLHCFALNMLAVAVFGGIWLYAKLARGREIR